jgi:hypothetical protein
MRLHIPLNETMRTALLDLAASERRTPQQQAAHLLELAVAQALRQRDQARGRERDEYLEVTHADQ